MLITDFLDTLWALAEGASLLLAVSYVFSWRGKLIGGSSAEAAYFGAFIGLACVLGMLTAVPLAEGVFFDARSMLIGVGSAFGGPIVAIVSSFIASAYRIYVGGGGVYSGVGVILSSAAIGLFYYVLRSDKSAPISLARGAVLGLVVHLAAVAWFTIIPDLDVRQTFLSISLPMLIVFTPATAILCSMMSDMNERLGQRQQLEDAKIRYESLYRQSPNAYLSLEATSGKILEASHAASTMFELPISDIISRKFSDLFVVKNLSDVEWAKAQNQLLTNPEESFCELQIQAGNAEPLWVALSCRPTVEADGTIVDVKLMLDDISPIKDAQEEVLYAKALLDETSKLGHIGGWEIDVASGKGSWTAETARIYGFAPEQPLTLDFGLKFYHPEDRSKIDAVVVQAIEQGVPWDSELRIINNEGQLRWLHSICSPRLRHGKTEKLVGMVQDITEKKLAEEKIVSLREERSSYQLKIRKSLVETVHAIALTVEKRDPYTAGHMSRVSQLATAIAHKVNMPQFEIDGISLAGDIHDLGKIYIPAEILNRPGKLTDTEFELIKTHSQIGYDIVKDIEFPWPIAQMILQHHERLDGTGYPNGLSGEQILLQSRILAVADVIEAITSHRPYRAALGIEKGIEVVAEGRGTLFDPLVVDAAIEVITKDGFKFKTSFG